MSGLILDGFKKRENSSFCKFFQFVGVFYVYSMDSRMFSMDYNNSPLDALIPTQVLTLDGKAYVLFLGGRPS
jgi:hypothetical protein